MAKVWVVIAQAAMVCPAGGADVGLVTWTEAVAPEAMFPKLHARFWVGAAPLMPQVPGPAGRPG